MSEPEMTQDEIDRLSNDLCKAAESIRQMLDDPRMEPFHERMRAYAASGRLIRDLRRHDEDPKVGDRAGLEIGDAEIAYAAGYMSHIETGLLDFIPSRAERLRRSRVDDDPRELETPVDAPLGRGLGQTLIIRVRPRNVFLYYDRDRPPVEHCDVDCPSAKQAIMIPILVPILRGQKRRPKQPPRSGR